MRQDVWKLEDAKARFSELVRRARSEGPQHVTVRGKPAAVIVAAEEFDEQKPTKPLGAFLESLPWPEGFVLDRDYPPDREPPDLV
ncbi:MAG TPA: type II toxin-antitoxin system Phd/YefM family antitoxin [Acidisphaera sp.]|nr:type II toxin-antitoxin system Phd/YefM family antitoxin [Acidisphaera sp.]